MAALDRGGHVEDLPGLGDIVGPEHPRALPGADGGRGERADQPFAGWPVERLPDEILVRQRDEHRPARRDEFTEPPASPPASAGCSCRSRGPGRSRSGQPGTPTRPPARRAETVSHDVGDDVVVLDPMRSGARWQPPACVHTSPTPYAAATSARSGSCPPHASLSRSPQRAQTAAPTSCRQVSTLMTRPGYAVADRGYEVAAARRSPPRRRPRHRAPPLPRRCRRCRRRRRTPSSTASMAASNRERRAAVVEGVGRAVHDRHDLQGPAQLGFLFAQALIGRSFQSSVLARLRCSLALHNLSETDVTGGRSCTGTGRATHPPSTARSN